MLPRDTEWSTHPWSPHAISGVPDFVSCTQFFSKHDPNCKRPQRLNKAFLFWASCWFPLEMVAHCKVAVWSQCCLPLPHYIRLPKKVLRCHAKKTHLVLQICSKSQPTTICDCDSVSVCQRSIANAVLWALLHCDMIAQCYKEVHYQYV